MASRVINQAVLDELNQNFSLLFHKALKENIVLNDLNPILNIIPTAKKTDKFKWMDLLGKAREWLGEREVRNQEANEYEISNKHYEYTMDVDIDDIEDDSLGIYDIQVAEIIQNIVELQRDHIFNLIVNGTTNQAWDGKAFFANDHPYQDATTFDNLLSGALSSTTLKQGITAMRKFKSYVGKELNLVADTLIIPPDLEWTARELIKSTTVISDTANYINILQGTIKNIIIDARLTDTDDWYLACSGKAIKPLIMTNRKAPTFSSQTAPDSDTVFWKNAVVYGGDARWGTGYSYPQLMIKYTTS